MFIPLYVIARNGDGQRAHWQYHEEGRFWAWGYGDPIFAMSAAVAGQQAAELLKNGVNDFRFFQLEISDEYHARHKDTTDSMISQSLIHSIIDFIDESGVSEESAFLRNAVVALARR